MPADYRTLLDQYDILKDAGVVTESLPAWSNRKNIETGTHEYDAGLEDNFIKRASVGIDRFLESTGLPGITEKFGGAVGGLIGNEEAGAAIGKGLPRMAASMLPFLVPVVGAPLGLASMSASAGSEAYTATGSPASGLIAATTAAVMPGVGNIARQAALKGMGANLVKGQVVGGVDRLLAKAGLGALTKEAEEEAVGKLVGNLAAGAKTTMAKQYIPKNLAQGLLAGTAENLAFGATGVAGGQLESVFSGQPYEFSPTTELLNLTLGQLPFAAMSAARHGRIAYGGRAAREHEAKLQTSINLSEKAIEQRRLNEEVSGKTDIETIVDTPEQIAAREARVTKLSDLREKQRAAKADETTAAEAERQKLADEDNATLEAQGKLPGHILGVPADSIPKRPVADPTAPVAIDGIRAPIQMTPQLQSNLRNAITGTDSLYAQSNLNTFNHVLARENPAHGPITLEEARILGQQMDKVTDPGIKLNTAEQRLAAAKDNVDLQDSIVEVNEVRQGYGLKPLDDVEISNRRMRFGLGSERDAIQSHIDETRRLATAKEEGIALRAEIKLKEAELTHVDPMVRASAASRLLEVGASSTELDNARHIANAPMTRDNAPVKNFMHEQAVKITESVPEVVPGDQQKFLDWSQGGVTALMQKHGMSGDDVVKWLNEEDSTVDIWRNRLEMQVKDGVGVGDYAKRHLMNQGVLEAEADRQAALVTKLAESPNLKADILTVPTEGVMVKKASAEMNTLLANDPEPTKKIFDEQGVADADALYTKLVGTGKIDEDVLTNLDGKVADYVFAKAREHQQLMGVLDGAERTKYVLSPKDSSEAVLKTLGKIADAEAKRAEQAADLSGISGIAPKTFMQNVISGEYISGAGKYISDVVGDIPGATRFGDMWKTPAWLAKISPHLAEFVSKGHQLASNARKMAREAYKAFGMNDQGKWDKTFIKSMRDKQVTGALSKWMGINQRRGAETGVKIISADDPEVVRALQGLSAEKQQIVKDQMGRQEISTKTMQQQELGKMREIYVVQGTEFLGPKTGLKYDQNLKLSNNMLDVLQTDWKNPEQAMRAQETLGRLQQQFVDKPAVFTEFQQLMTGKMAEYNKRKEFFDANPAWATSQRYGKYTFTYVKGKERVTDSADSKAEAREIANGNQIISIDPNLDHGDMPVSYEQRTISPEQGDARWFNNHATWLNKNATYWSRELFRAQSKALLADPELSQRPDALRKAKQHAENMLSPDPKFGLMANRIASQWYLGWNPASAMVNSTQLMVRGAAEMSKLTGNPIDSYKRILSGYKEMYNMWMPGAKGVSEEKQRIAKRLEQDGITTVTAEMFGMGEESGAELNRALAGRGPLKSLPGNLSRVFQNTGMSMFKAMERVNNTGAVFAAFDYYRGQKGADGKQLSFEDAYKRALQFNQSVNDVGGKANRPIDIMSGTGEVSKSLGLMATSLQTYNIGTIGQIVSYIKNGKFDPPDLSPGEKYHYKTALAHLLGAQFAAAGALGMPFVGTAIALIDQTFPSAEVGKNLRDFVNGIVPKFLEDDEEDGGTIADLAMTGISSAFGWDMQSRLSMGNPVAGVSEINGFQPEMLFGAPTDLVKKFLTGGFAAAQGDMSLVGNMMPPIARRLAQLGDKEGKVRNYNGEPVLDQPTIGEKVGLALGFQPTRISEFSKANRMANKSAAIRRDETARFNQAQASSLVEKGNFADVKNEIRAKMESGEYENEADAKKGAEQIASALVELTFPVDMRRKLAPKDAAIAKWFTLPLNKPTEAARTELKAVTMRNLGFPIKPRDMVLAQTMDQFSAQNPELTRADARRLAEKHLGRVKKEVVMQ